MARSTVPPPPPAPEGGADSPIPAVAAPPASKPAAAKPAGSKPAAAKPAGSKPAPETAAVAAPVVASTRPDPYAAAPVAAYSAPLSPYAGAPAAVPSTLSVLSLVFGVIGLVLSLFLIGLLPALAGVIIGHVAMKREPHARGMAIAGLVTGYVGIAISVLWTLLILVPILIVWIAVGAFSITGGF